MTRIRRKLARSLAKARSRIRLDPPDLFAIAGVATFAAGLAFLRVLDGALPWLWVGAYLMLVARGASARRA